jgi:hypothetical protein
LSMLAWTMNFYLSFLSSLGLVHHAQPIFPLRWKSHNYFIYLFIYYFYQGSLEPRFSCS